MKRKELTGIFACVALLFFAVYAFAASVPETGQTKCYNNTVEIPCPSPGQPFYGQDANYSINPMSYTKLDGSGNALPDSATTWVTVRDNVTGLTWEMKTNMDGVKNYNDPHDADNKYDWYDGNPATNGGDPGHPSNGTDTEDFIRALNDASYGGYSDWRLSNVNELLSIVNYGIKSRPSIDTGYFLNTQLSSFWSSTTYMEYSWKVWEVNFGYGDLDDGNHKYNYGVYGTHARAVRGVQSGSLDNLAIGSFDAVDSGSIDAASTAASSYTDNGDGTITDNLTRLMWQQSSSSGKTWEQALAYCEELDIGGNTDWRMPTIKELQRLVDRSRRGPAINTMYFLNTASSLYWSSTTYANDTYGAWGVEFIDGLTKNFYKYNLYYVRAVRGGQVPDHSVLSVSPAIQNVAKDAGVTTFSISNTGTGTMPWTAAATSGSNWLSITSGASGSNAGTITCSYSANTTTSSRTATIRITATGATGSPVDVTVTQAPTSTTSGCTATIDGNLSLQIPYLSYIIPMFGTVSFWANFVYEFNPTYSTLILFKYLNSGINNPPYSCAGSTLSGDLKIHIPDVLLPDGSTHLWLDMEYSPANSSEINAYFLVTNHGVVSK